MEICSIIINFIVIYLAVRLAINPLLDKQQKTIIHKNDFTLAKLRDIGVLSDTELREITEIYKNKGVNEKYEKYEKILNELKEIGYYTEEQCCSKIDKLKNHFKVN